MEHILGHAPPQTVGRKTERTSYVRNYVRTSLISKSVHTFREKSLLSQTSEKRMRGDACRVDVTPLLRYMMTFGDIGPARSLKNPVICGIHDARLCMQLLQRKIQFPKRKEQLGPSYPKTE
jgi:hypothetical protein